MADSSHGTGVVSSDAGGLAETDVHDILRNDRRRNVIGLLEANGALEVRELAERIATIESGESPPPRKKRLSAYNSLKQTHLPKLDEHGVVRYDPDGKRVSLGDRSAEVTRYLGDRDRGWRTATPYYWGIGVIGLLAVLGSQLLLAGRPFPRTIAVCTAFVGVLVAITLLDRRFSASMA